MQESNKLYKGNTTTIKTLIPIYKGLTEVIDMFMVRITLIPIYKGLTLSDEDKKKFIKL